jgi:hypothetical protein
MPLYSKLEDAEALLFPDGVTRVTSPSEYYGWQAAYIQTRGIARVWDASNPPPARVNHGRWIADCRACGNGMFTHPVWRIACCGECGAVYRDLPFPERIVEITRLLLERPNRAHQNWEPGEGLFALRAENFLHRVAACS